MEKKEIKNGDWYMWMDNKQVCQADGYLDILNMHLQNNQIAIVEKPIENIFNKIGTNTFKALLKEFGFFHSYGYWIHKDDMQHRITFHVSRKGKNIQMKMKTKYSKYTHSFSIENIHSKEELKSLIFASSEQELKDSIHIRVINYSNNFNV